MTAQRTYFDHNATSPPDPRVVEAMLPFLGSGHANPSSVHREGQAARAAIEEAREQVARLIGVVPVDLVFTASGTEANNAVLRSVFGRFAVDGHLVISAFEHPSIAVTASQLEIASELETAGVRVTRVAPDSGGVIAADAVAAALRPETRLVAVMLANNELGTIQPVAEIARVCRDRGVLVLCDAVQAVGKIAVDADALGVDFLTLGGHKFHGPVGSAALWIRSGVAFEGSLTGGSQERRRRASTENLPAIVGLGRAAELAFGELCERGRVLGALRDRFESGLASIPGATVNCRSSLRLPNTSHVSIAGVDGLSLLIRLDMAGYAVSTGAACASGSLEPSATLLAIGLDPDLARSSIRVSFGITNNAAEVDRFLDRLATEVAALLELEMAGPAVGSR